MKFTRRELESMIYVLRAWGGFSPYDGTVKESSNPPRNEVSRILVRLKRELKKTK